MVEGRGAPRAGKVGEGVINRGVGERTPRRNPSRFEVRLREKLQLRVSFGTGKFAVPLLSHRIARTLSKEIDMRTDPGVIFMLVLPF